MQYRQKYPERVRGWIKKHKLKNKEKIAIANCRYLIKKLYGLTLEQYNDMLVNQVGVCAICKEKPADRRLSVDHNHKTGKVRGLLCRNCNTALGGFKDSVLILKSAIEYLGRDYGSN